MEILQLRYFYESAKSESFSKTAALFGVPTTSVSASVKRLEQELNRPLFDRTSNRIVLNEKGRQFLESMKVVFTELDKAVAAVSCMGTDERPIRLLIRAMRRAITDKIIQYRALHPNITFQTTFDFNERDRSGFDIIIDSHSDAYAEYEKQLLFRVPLRFKCGADNRLCGHPITLKELADQNFVSMGAGSNLHKVLLDACHRAGFVPKFSVLCNDIECYERLVASGIGIALSREKETPEPGIRYLNVTDFHQEYEVFAYCKQESCYGNIQSFLSFLLTGK